MFDEMLQRIFLYVGCGRDIVDIFVGSNSAGLSSTTPYVEQMMRLILPQTLSTVIQMFMFHLIVFTYNINCCSTYLLFSTSPNGSRFYLVTEESSEI